MERRLFQVILTGLLFCAAASFVVQAIAQAAPPLPIQLKIGLLNMRNNEITGHGERYLNDVLEKWATQLLPRADIIIISEVPNEDILRRMASIFDHTLPSGVWYATQGEEENYADVGIISKYPIVSVSVKEGVPGDNFLDPPWPLSDPDVWILDVTIDFYGYQHRVLASHYWTGDENWEDRRESSEIVADLVRNEGRPVFFGGDLNSGFPSRELVPLGDAGLHEAISEISGASNGLVDHLFSNLRGYTPISYEVFCTPPPGIEGCIADEAVLPSDHAFIVVTFEFMGTWLPEGSSAQGDDMQPGEVLLPEQSITSPNGRYRLIYQHDGNLVLYRDGGNAVWASATGAPVGVLLMQTDGNLVIYGPGRHAFWSSATDGTPGSRLLVQDDGNVVIYRPDGTAAWETGTWTPVGPSAQGDDMQPGEVLLPEQSITSPNGRYFLIYQHDGNLVLYRDGGQYVWDSATGAPVGVLIMQTDGNLVIYGPGGQVVWASATDGDPGSRLLVQDDGNVVIYRPDGTAAWATDTMQP